ncbi:hypothetical protein ACWCW2_33455, partial [Streptomyces sp. NPDC001773]
MKSTDAELRARNKITDGLRQASPAVQSAGQRDEGVMEFEAALPVDGKALNAVAFEAAVAEDLPGLHAREDVLDAGADLLVGLAGHGCRV